MPDNESIIELRAIRENMRQLGNLDTSPRGLSIAITELAAAIRTLAYHIEQLEKRHG